MGWEGRARHLTGRPRTEDGDGRVRAQVLALRPARRARARALPRRPGAGFALLEECLELCDDGEPRGTIDLPPESNNKKGQKGGRKKSKL